MTARSELTATVDGGRRVENMVLEAARSAFETEIEDEQYQGDPFEVSVAVEIDVDQGGGE